MNHLHINSNKKWKYRFFILITGQSISVIGSTAVQFSVIWWLSTLTASPMVLAYAGLAAYVPQILLGPFSGVWIDRFDRKKVIIFSDLFTGGVSTLFAILLLTAEPPIWVFYILLGMRAVGSVFHAPALQAVVPAVVPKEELVRANAWDQFLQSGALMLGPVLGAFMFASLPLSIILLSDLLGAIIASISIGLITIKPELISQEPSHDFLNEFREGIYIYLNNKRLLVFTLVSAVCMVAFMPITAFYPLMTSDYFHGSSYQASLVELSYSAGMMAGAVLISQFNIKTHTSNCHLTYIGLLGIGITSLLSGLLPASTPAFYFFGLLCFGMGESATFYNVLFTAYMQKTIPVETQGRAFSFLSSVVSLTMPIGLLIAGPVSELYGVKFWFLISGNVIVIVVIVMLTRGKIAVHLKKLLLWTINKNQNHCFTPKKDKIPNSIKGDASDEI